MKPHRPITDRQLQSRIVYAVIDTKGNIDANRIYRPTMIDHATELAKALTEETKELYVVVPVILK